jgi:hypothetical protein
VWGLRTHAVGIAPIFPEAVLGQVGHVDIESLRNASFAEILHTTFQIPHVTARYSCGHGCRQSLPFYPKSRNPSSPKEAHVILLLSNLRRMLRERLRSSQTGEGKLLCNTSTMSLKASPFAKYYFC